MSCFAGISGCFAVLPASLSEPVPEMFFISFVLVGMQQLIPVLPTHCQFIKYIELSLCR